MRRPQTKTPYAYYRTATRHRGRPVHRVYAATPRPPITGTWLYWNTGNLIAYSKDGTNWWMLTDKILQDWLDLKGATETGEVWNRQLWEIHTDIVPSWPTIQSYAGQVFKGPWGPCPYTPDDSFTK